MVIRRPESTDFDGLSVLALANVSDGQSDLLTHNIF